jgi:rod shape-determining protein MreC
MRFIYTKTFAKIFTIFVFLALFVILDMEGYIGLLKDGFFRVYGYTTQKVTGATDSVKTVFKTLFTIRSLVSENASLNQKIDQLSFDNARLKSAQDENTALRRALNYKQQSSLNLLPTEVLILDSTGFSQTLVVDKGENSKVALNQPVVVAPGLLVGKVTKIYPNSAEVTLITNPDMVVNAEAVDSGARGLIRGEHGLGLSFDLVTQNEFIKSGDQLITSGLSEDFPRGLLVGEVAGLRSSATDLFQKASVTPAADLRNLRFLFIVQ